LGFVSLTKKPMMVAMALWMVAMALGFVPHHPTEMVGLQTAAISHTTGKH
jgi:hypothetical protein